MCLAIYKPAGTEIPVKHLENGFSNHSDGAGMSWAENGKLYVKKGMFNLEEVLEQYEAIKHLPALIHFRKATHGKVDATNCHPFLFNDGKLALIHNGVLPIKCNIEGLSDTAHFVKLVLEPMVKAHGVPVNDGALNYLICTSIGSDKIAIMDAEGKTYIFNEDKGQWDGGAWYSNTSFRYAYTATRYVPGSAASSPLNNDWKSHPYFADKAANNGKTTVNPDNSWRKHWKGDEDKEADEAYVDFWKKSTGVGSTALRLQGCNQHAKTTRIPLLLENGSDTVDEAGNVVTVEEAPPKKFTEGQMCEYGWYDVEIESSIEAYQLNLGLTRNEAVIRVFTEM
jgi:hypothetical protein